MTQKKQHSHQYTFTYEALPSAFRNDKQGFLDYLEDDGLEFLQFWWDHVAEKLDVTERMSSAGMAYEIRTLENKARVALIILPKPKKHGEAFFLALVNPRKTPSIFPWKNFARVYTLSHLEKEDGRSDTIFGEWTPRGKFVPGVEGLPPELEVFFKKATETFEKDR